MTTKMHVGGYDVEISLREQLTDRPIVEVTLYVREPLDVRLEMTPAFARRLARRLVKYAAYADPPTKKRRS